MKIIYSKDSITPEEIMKFLTLSGQSGSLVAEMIKNKEVQKKAQELNIEVSVDELQKFADSFRAANGLFSYDDTVNFLKNNGLTEEDFEQFCELNLLVSAVKDRLADENKINEYFVNNRSELDRARISIIVLADENLANEIILEVTEEDADFHALARKHSQDEMTKFAGGYIGWINRQALPPDMAAKVFNAEAGEVLGPFPAEKNYQLIYIEEVKRAEMSDKLKEAIKDQIYNEWAFQFYKDGIKISPGQ
jgi:parvulin-like peptidyl-prolyl isomerase